MTTGLGIGLGGDVAGLAGSLAGGMASLGHTEKVALAVTNRRLLLCEVTPVRYEVTRVVAAIPFADIATVAAGHGRSGGIKIPAVDVTLRDGSTHSYEVGLTQKHHLAPLRGHARAIWPPASGRRRRGASRQVRRLSGEVEPSRVYSEVPDSRSSVAPSDELGVGGERQAAAGGDAADADLLQHGDRAGRCGGPAR